LLGTLDGHVGQVNEVALDASAKLLASAGFDGTVRVWALGDHRGQQVALLTSSRSPVWSVALSDDGCVLARGGEGGVVHVWDPSSGVCVGALRADRRYERLDISGTTGITDAQRTTLLALGAVDRANSTALRR